jgi:hypothetical protein
MDDEAVSVSEAVLAQTYSFYRNDRERAPYILWYRCHILQKLRHHNFVLSLNMGFIIDGNDAAFCPKAIGTMETEEVILEPGAKTFRKIGGRTNPLMQGEDGQEA